MKSSNKQKKQDVLIMVVLFILILIVVDFSNPTFLDATILVLAIIWIALTVNKWRKKG